MTLGSDRLSLTIAVAGVLVAGALAAAAGPPAAAATTTTRYAAPNGSGTICTRTAPCDIVEAMRHAPDGAVVIVTPGQYGSAIAPIDQEITNDSEDGHPAITVLGQSGKTAPVIFTASAHRVFLINSSIANVHIVHQGVGTGLILNNSGGNGVQVETASDVACLLDASTLYNSTCSSSQGTAVSAEENGGSNTGTLRNVTAIGGGASTGIGVECDAEGGGICQLQVVNSIVHGDLTDAKVSVQDQNSSGKIVLLNSSVHSAESTSEQGSTAEIHRDSSDITVPAVFVNPANHDFREAAGSPTIDAGFDGGVFGKKDVAGHPRFMGDAVDMGAFEFLVAPHVTKVHVVHVGKHSVRARVTVDTQGLAASAKLLARRKGATISAKRTPLAARSGKRTVSLVVGQLKRHARYRLTAVVANGGGTTSHSVHAKTH